MEHPIRLSARTRLIYLCIGVLFCSVFLITNYAFNKSRELLVEQEASIISQYMGRSQMALKDLTDSIRKLSAASSTNKEVSELLKQAETVDVYSAENASRIRRVEETLTFYRNVFFDYRVHYMILGADGTVYSVADGIDNSSYFGSRFAQSVREQAWYREFMESSRVSAWIAPCIYDDKGVFKEEKKDPRDEEFLLFIRKIRDYNTLKPLGVSFVSVPIENLDRILVPYEGASLALADHQGRILYASGEEEMDSGIWKELEHLTGQEIGSFRHRGEGKEYLVSYAGAEGIGGCLINTVPVVQITRAVDQLYGMATAVMALIALGAVLACFAMYIYVTGPLNHLIKKVSGVHIAGTRISDVKEAGLQKKQVFGITEAEQEISRMVDYIEQLSAQSLKQKEIEQNLRYEMLRAQLNPHFLFNTLNVIKWSAMISGAGNIADMIASLGVLLENTMNRGEEETALKEEIRVVRAWVEIKNWALKNKIQIHTDVEPGLEDFKVIRFFLQPLVENAVLHGMEHVENGEIWIRAKQYDGQVCVTVQDNGMGIEPERLEEILKELDRERGRRHVTGIGLASIHELMRLRYGEGCGLYIESRKSLGTKVYAVFPDRRGSGYAEGNDCG